RQADHASEPVLAVAKTPSSYQKGLLVTTGTFTRSAREESSRDGAPPVELVDGDDLCDLLKEYELGVRTRVRQVEDIDLDTDFLKQFEVI
ncbi:MAG: restriction endonuclease, partial [Acidimicrobiaceae bacterium]|nr:restriction endonuclease [Acidimicrobiaceae bacterium]